MLVHLMRLKEISCVAAVFTAFLTIVARAGAQAFPDAGVVHQLLRQPFSDRPGMDVVVITVDYPPGGATPPHEHPGYVYAYVLQGTMVSKLDNQKTQTYTKGQMWSELPNEQHMIARNASATKPAELLVFFIIPHGAKLIEFLPPP